jgi:hypothetical protein
MTVDLAQAQDFLAEGEDLVLGRQVPESVEAVRVLVRPLVPGWLTPSAR